MNRPRFLLLFPSPLPLLPRRWSQVTRGSPLRSLDLNEPRPLNERSYNGRAEFGSSFASHKAVNRFPAKEAAARHQRENERAPVVRAFAEISSHSGRKHDSRASPSVRLWDKSRPTPPRIIRRLFLVRVPDDDSPRRRNTRRRPANKPTVTAGNNRAVNLRFNDLSIASLTYTVFFARDVLCTRSRRDFLGRLPKRAICRSDQIICHCKSDLNIAHFQVHL